MEERQLIEGLKNREPEALFALYNAYRDRVTAVVRRFVRDEWDAEEVTQDVFWTVHRKIELFREDSALWSWMYRIAVNAAKMKIRRYSRIPTPVSDEALGDDAMWTYSGQPRPDEELEFKILVTSVEAYLASATPTNRALYLQMDVDGRSKEEVASDLDLTVPAVKTRLHRMRSGIRDRIERAA